MDVIFVVLLVTLIAATCWLVAALGRLGGSE